MATDLQLGTPLAQALNDVIQPKLVEVGWSTGGADDSALAEYIMLMLVNGKTQDQIASELSNDLLNLGPEDSGATDFARWLFEQLNDLNQQLNGSAPEVAADSQTQPEEMDGQQQGGASGSQAGQDAEMGDAADGATEPVIPTGPKSMRNGNKRIMGQISKAMDRSSEAQLHRVRTQQGVGRVDTHREPPKGPRNQRTSFPRTSMSNGRPMNPMQRGMPNGVPRGSAQTMMNMSPEQQMQLLAMYEEQARRMSEILSPHQQSMFPTPAINPAFGNQFNQQQQKQSGRSLFDRIDEQPRGQRKHRSQTEAQQMTGNEDGPSSSMEVESSQPKPDEETICRFNLTCSKKDCPYAHQSPAAPPGTTIDVTDVCSFGAACKNRKCVGRHPSPAQKAVHQSEQDCKFFPNCHKFDCPFKHPSMPACRNGADCTTPGCKFTHIKTMCKFNPCTKAYCPYKHEEGQKRGPFADKVWTANGDGGKQHVSERKFIDEGQEEELIIPGSAAAEEPQQTGVAEVAS